MSQWIGLSVGLLALFVLVGCGPSSFPTEPSVIMVREENTVGQFSFEHPLDWAFVQTPAALQGDNTIADTV